MSRITSQFQAKLHEFIQKLSRNFETNLVTATSCEGILKIWAKHLNKVKNSKVRVKVDNFVDEMLDNIGLYFAEKYPGEVSLAALSGIAPDLRGLRDKHPER